MMKPHALFLGLLGLSALFFTAAGYALTIPASEDGYSAGDKLTLSAHRSNSLLVDANRKSLLYFDLSEIPTDAVVRWAKLRLFLPLVQRPGAGLSVHLVTSQWEEAKASNIPSISAGTLGIIPPDRMGSRRFVTVDVTGTVQSWISGGTLNEGFAIQPVMKSGTQTASVMLTSKDGPIFGLPAELDIDFQPEGGVDKPVAFDQLPLSIRSYFGPTITAQPSASVGSSIGALTVSASGVGQLRYQWMRDGVSIAGATSERLATQGLQSGTYAVTVSNGFSSVSSNSVLFVVPNTPIAPSEFALVTGGTLPDSSEIGAEAVASFYIGKTEVTESQWRKVLTWALDNGYTDLPESTRLGDNFPVTDVSWYDVMKWCNARSEKEGKTPVYRNGTEVYRTGWATPTEAPSADGYRLPSDKEWEFAARGGTQTHGYTYSGSNDLDEVGWYAGNSPEGDAHEVAKKNANELGIYDMSGNVWEWTGSWYPGAEGLYRVIRGGGFFNYYSDFYYCAVAHRGYFPEYAHTLLNNLGFRVALSAAP